METSEETASSEILTTTISLAHPNYAMIQRLN